jgi:hypothetical protein
MAASLVFGVVNHFLLASPDHVSHVAQQWRTLFATTAVLLALTEAATAARIPWHDVACVVHALA